MSGCTYRHIDDDGTRWVCTEPAGHPAPHMATPCSPECRGLYPRRIGLWKRPKQRPWWLGVTSWVCVMHNPMPSVEEVP